MSYIDLRDLEGEELAKWKEALGNDFEGLKKNEPTMIPEYEFEDYAQELADDIGAIDNNQDWPLNHIDWEAAAKELKMDYSEVEVDGQTYYYRSY